MLNSLRLYALALLTLLGILLTGQLYAQTRPLDVDQAFRLTESTLADGAQSFRFDIAPGYYLYRDTFRAVTADGTELPLDRPPAEQKDDPNFGLVDVYHDRVTLTLASSAPEFTLSWQGCKEDSICYPPQRRVIAATAGMEAPDADSGFTIAEAVPSSLEGAPRLTLADEPGLLEDLSRRGGVWLVLAGFLGFGMMLAFTPCVFPMIPIVAGMVMGRGDSSSARRGFVLSAVYVLAMATAFAALGGVAAWSGQNLQLALQSPAVLTVGAGLFVLLALASFGLFELALPQALTARLGRLTGKRGSVGGAALLGFSSALIVGPCVTAPLAGALLYIAQTGDVALGAAALFALGLGQGLPLLAVGVFGPQILPRAGAWMGLVREGFGVMFLGLAIWLMGRVLPGPAVLALWAVLLTGTGVVIWQRGMAPVGAILTLAGVLQGVGAGLGAGDPLAPLAPLIARAALTTATDGAATLATSPAATFATVRTPAALESALRAADGPTLVYVTADWCTVCRSIERGPLTDPAVVAALEPLARIKVDVSDFGADSQTLLNLLASVGPPTMVFLDAVQTERPGTRLIGEIDSAKLLHAVDGALP